MAPGVSNASILVGPSSSQIVLGLACIERGDVRVPDSCILVKHSVGDLDHGYFTEEERVCDESVFMRRASRRHGCSQSHCSFVGGVEEWTVVPQLD